MTPPRPGDEADLSKLLDSDRYQDYVFKDGEFVGRFDEMYRKFPDPWNCVADSTSLENEIFCTVLRSISPGVSTVLDVGCGLGTLTARISEAVEPSEVYGIDVSQAAIEKAKQAYPGIHFSVHDLLDDSWDSLPDRMDLITMAEVCWYIIPGIRRVFGKLHELLNHGGHLVVLQNFYRPEDQQYGGDVMQGPDELVSLVRGAGFQIDREMHLHSSPPMKALIWARKL